jgi:hypothetical protein
MHKPLREYAREVRADWKSVYFGAKPYLDAMSSLEDINDSYGYDNARTIVLYFLANATTWRGGEARRIKAELKKLANYK